jgi:sulfur carrier protein ThiS
MFKRQVEFKVKIDGVPKSLYFNSKKILVKKLLESLKLSGDFYCVFVNKKLLPDNQKIKNTDEIEISYYLSKKF